MISRIPSLGEPLPHSAGDADGRFQDALFGLPCLFLSCNGGARVAVARQGAQVLSWCDANGRERLYLSPQTGGARHGDPADVTIQPIRGGIPICFPQFSDRGPLLKHGFARSSLWACAAASPVGSGVVHTGKDAVTLTLHDDAQTRVLWPESFHAEVSVMLAPDRLSVTLAITNSGDVPWEFTTALHTYLRVNDIRKTQLAGLQCTRYQDATADNVEAVEDTGRLEIHGEVDRVYLSPPPVLHLLENGLPSLRIEQSGFTDTVVWNPGPVKAALLADFPDDDWMQMLCVEAACVATPVVLQARATWVGSQVLSMVSNDE